MSESEETLYESTTTQSRTAIASYLRHVADALAADEAVPIADSVTVDPPATSAFEIEVEREGDEMSVEFEIEWVEGDADATTDTGDVADDNDETATASPDSATDDVADSDGTDDDPIDSVTDPDSGGTVDAPTASLGTFELYRDRADEWRWRLRHDNGNIIGDSGEGYGRKASAKKGIRSVKANASGAPIEEQD